MFKVSGGVMEERIQFTLWYLTELNVYELCVILVHAYYLP